jgi:hypothetical protein
LFTFCNQPGLGILPLAPGFLEHSNPGRFALSMRIQGIPLACHATMKALFNIARQEPDLRRTTALKISRRWSPAGNGRYCEVTTGRSIASRLPTLGLPLPRLDEFQQQLHCQFLLFHRAHLLTFATPPVATVGIFPATQ